MSEFVEKINPVQQGMEILRAACQRSYPEILLPTSPETPHSRAPHVINIIEQAKQTALKAEAGVEYDPYTVYFHKVLLALDRLGLTQKGHAKEGQGFPTIQVIGTPGSYNIAPPINPEGEVQIDHNYNIKEKFLGFFPLHHSISESVKLSAYTRSLRYRDWQQLCSETWRIDWEAAKKILDPFFEGVMRPENHPEALLRRGAFMRDEIVEKVRLSFAPPRKKLSWRVDVDGGGVLLLRNSINNCTEEEMRVLENGAIFFRQILDSNSKHPKINESSKATLSPTEIRNPHGAFLKFAAIHREYC